MIEKKSILRTDDTVLINDGENPKTRRVSTMKITEKQDGVDLVEQSVKETMKARTDLIQKHGAEYLKHLRSLDPNEGLGETPGWFGPVSKSIDWTKEEFLYEVTMLTENTYYIRNIDTEKSYEVIAKLSLNPENIEKVFLKPLATIRYEKDSEKRVENTSIKGVVKTNVEKDEERGEEEGGDDGERKSANVETMHKTSLENEGLKQSVKMILEGINLRHRYIDEMIYYDYEDEVLDVVEKDFKIHLGSHEKVPVWTNTLFYYFGADIQERKR